MQPNLHSPATRATIGSLVSSTVLFVFAAIATSDRSRGYLFLVAALAALLITISIYGFVLLLLPRLGRFYAICTISLIWFVLATGAAWFTPSCPSDLSSRCSVQGAAASGYPFLLIPPGVWFVWVLTKVLIRVMALAVTWRSRRRSRPSASSTGQGRTPSSKRHSVPKNKSAAIRRKRSR